jgi:hypothetical protein
VLPTTSWFILRLPAAGGGCAGSKPFECGVAKVLIPLASDNENKSDTDDNDRHLFTLMFSATIRFGNPTFS